MQHFTPFHLAFPILDIEETRRFYQDLLGCEMGRSAENWIDFNFFGHQLSAHVRPGEVNRTRTSKVDGDDIPIRHFGAVLEWKEWHRMAEKLRAAGVPFIVEPHVRFKGEIGEQATMFIEDPAGNALEFKSFQDPARIFAR